MASRSIIMIFGLVFFKLACSSRHRVATKPVEYAKGSIELLYSSNDGEKDFSKSEIVNILCAMDRFCSSNAEFSEVSNEILFAIFLKEPKLALRVLTENSHFDLDLC